MLRISALILAFIMIALAPGQGKAINVKLSNIRTLPPGVPPENAFPIVCYLVGMRADVTQALEAEGSPRFKKGKTFHPLHERYKNGISLPQYEGYIVIDEAFRITVHGRFPNKWLEEWADEVNSMPQDDLVRAHRQRALRWSWNGVACAIRNLTGYPAVYALAYTLGQQPDPNYIPLVKKTVILPIEKVHNASWQVNAARLRPIKEIDITITNLKPGMTFKLIDDNFLFE